MNREEIKLALTKTTSLDQVIDFYVKNLKTIKDNGLACYCTRLIDTWLEMSNPTREHTKRRIKAMNYVRKFSPALINHEFSSRLNPTRGCFEHNGRIFIRENWQYTIYNETIKENPYIGNRSSVAECLGIRKILRSINQISAVTHCILKADTYLAVRLTDLDAILDIIDVDLLEKSYFLCRFLDYSQVYTSLTDTLLPLSNLNPPYSVISNSVYPVSQGFSQTMNMANQDISEKISERIAKATDFCASYYTADFHKTIPEKIKNQTLRVMLLTSKSTTALQYFIRDIAEGFERLGFLTLVSKEKDNEATGIRSDVTITTIADFKPDLIFQIDYCRYSNAIIPKNIPFMFWIQDQMMHNIGSSEHYEKFTDYDFTLFAHKPEFYGYLKYPKIEYFPIPVNTRLFSGNVDTEYDCDISIVKHFGPPSLDMRINGEDYTERILKILTPIFKKDVYKIMTREEYAKVLSPLFPDLDLNNKEQAMLIDQIMITLGNYLCRASIIDWTVDLNCDVHLYGNGWNEIPKYAKYAKGPIQNGTSLSTVYNRTKINLSIHPWLTSHPRVFEAIASNGFMLVKKIGVRDQAPLEDLLAEGEGYVLFTDQRDFEKKVYHYLKHEEERKAIIHKGYEVVTKKWSAEAAAKTLLDILGKRFI